MHAFSLGKLDVFVGMTEQMSIAVRYFRTFVYKQESKYRIVPAVFRKYLHCMA